MENYEFSDGYNSGIKKKSLTKKQKIFIACLASSLVVIIFLICLLCCNSSGSARSKAISLIENYISRGFYDQASDKITELLEKNPDDEELWSLLAKIKSQKDSSQGNQNVNVNIDTSSLENSIEKNFEIQRQESEKMRLQSEKNLEIQRQESEKTMKEMQNLIRKQQEQQELQKKQQEQEEKLQKQKEEQRKKEEEARKAKEAELARKNAQLKKEIDDVNEVILLGKAALNSGNISEALSYFTEAQKKLPVSQGEPDFSASKYSEMAKALWEASQTESSAEQKKNLIDQAKTYAETAVSKNPKDASSHFIIGMYNLDKKDMPKALESLTKAATYDANNYLYFYNLGRVQYMLKKFTAAKSSFSTSCSLNSVFAPARYNLALTNLRLNDTKSALSDLRKAHDIDPRHEKAYLEEARLLSRLSDLNGAITAYLNVVKINNMNRDALNELAAVYSRAGKLSESESYFRKSLALLPQNTDDPVTYYNLSSVLYEENKITEAVTYAKKAYDTKDSVKDSSAKANIVYNYALISEKTGDIDNAIKYYSEVFSYNPNHIKTYINLGSIYLNFLEPDIENALSLFLKAYSIDKNNFEANNNLGSAYLLKKEFKEAITYFQNALKIDSKNNEVRSNLAQAFASDQQFDNAKTTYLELLKLDSSNWNAFLELSKVCLAMGDSEGAEKYLVTLQEKAPDFRKDEVSSLLKSIEQN